MLPVPAAACPAASPPLPFPSPAPHLPTPADRHGYDPFVLELDLKPFGAHQPKISLQSHIGNGVSFLNKTLSAKLFSPTANAEGRCGGAGGGGGQGAGCRVARRGAWVRWQTSRLHHTPNLSLPAAPLLLFHCSQLMLDFLREFKHDGEMLLLR